MTPSPAAQSLFDKVWASHVVTPESASNPAVLYIDLHLIHEVTSPQAFTELEQRGLPVRRPDRTLATIDHSTPTLINADGTRPFVTAQAERQVEQLIANATTHDIPLHGWDSPSRGIVHVMGPELGAVQPGMTIVCGDSHTATHGAFGCLAFGIGTTQVGHVLATQCLLMRKPKSMAIHVNGDLGTGVTPKDVILHIIAQIGVGGGTGHTIEYRGNVFEEMSMEGRMTVCNMSIEAGARAGMIAPDQTTFDWLRDRPMLPDTDYDQLCETWRNLRSDPNCTYDREVIIDAADIRPMLTYGTHPGHGVAIDALIPAPKDASDQKSLDYMQVQAGASMQGLHVDRVFIGSCTNSRIEDMREAARILSQGRVPDTVTAIVVPGSEAVKLQAEAEGLHDLITASGAEWREPGCSMCIAMNGDLAAPGELVVSTSNRNFAGRQGPGARTVLASPAMAAAAAISGKIVDVRNFA